jgi:hypothetical protein
MANKVKTLTVTLTDTEEGTVTNFKAKGLSDFEIVGILSYYLDACKVNMIRSTGGVNDKDSEIQQEDDSRT